MMTMGRAENRKVSRTEFNHLQGCFNTNKKIYVETLSTDELIARQDSL